MINCFNYQQNSKTVCPRQPAHKHNADDRSTEKGVHSQSEHKQQEGWFDSTCCLHYCPWKRGMNDESFKSDFKN